jgi:hypothetical protein
MIIPILEVVCCLFLIILYYFLSNGPSYFDFAITLIVLLNSFVLYEIISLSSKGKWIAFWIVIFMILTFCAIFFLSDLNFPIAWVQIQSLLIVFACIGMGLAGVKTFFEIKQLNFVQTKEK